MTHYSELHKKKLLDEKDFIRHKIYSEETSTAKRYKSLVISDGWVKLILYELITCLFGSIPGSIGIILRKIFFPLLFKKIGKGVIFGKNVTIRHPEKIEIGNKVVIDDYAFLDARGASKSLRLSDRVILNRSSYVQAKVGDIYLGEESSVGAYAKVISQGPIFVDKNVTIAGNAVIAGGKYIVEKDRDSAMKGRYTLGEIFVGENSLIGMGSIIQDGVRVGENSIVAPNSVVFDDVLPNTVVLGNPAKPWRSRSSSIDTSREEKIDQNIEKAINSKKYVKEIKTFLEELFFIDFSDGSVDESDSLIENGYLDSISLFRIITWLESYYNFTIDYEDVTPEALESVNKIAGFVSTRKTE